ncbi:hypothetical protein [Pistricoccus aurantiacus]|uniref:hypothetical protein n=1 Tax=Pistricoccus aurantiacus TaxID=1883414 RepID=UPI00364165BF
MDSKYKAGLNRLTILIAAALLAWLAGRAPSALATILLGLAVIWLLATATQIGASHRWPTRAPWQLVMGLLLAALLWFEPATYAAWLWGFPVLLMLPQPRWSAATFVLLATLAWYRVQQTLIDDGNGIQGLFVGLLLFVLMVLGQGRAMKLIPLWQRIKQRRRLLPRTRLWSELQLVEDLPREIARCQREGSHADLLLQVPRHQYWAVVDQCNLSIHEFEHCYRLDRETLAVILINRDTEQALQRRHTLMESFSAASRARIVKLASSLSLDDEHQALKLQSVPLRVDEEPRQEAEP